MEISFLKLRIMYLLYNMNILFYITIWFALFCVELQEYEHRFSIWLDNLKFVHEYNQAHSSHWLGMGPFADLHYDEWRGKMHGYHPELKPFQLHALPKFKYSDVNVDSLPESVDWRERNAVSEVKNQRLCGSCWAFSAVGAIEGINAIFTGKKLSLSEQELVDCDLQQDHGCHGGLMDFAFDFVIENQGLDTEKDYPYKGEEGICDKDRRNRHVVTIDGYEDVPQNDETALLKAVANQPVSVAIEADQRAFQLYSGGVFDDEDCGTSLNHGVLIVGYGTERNGTHEMPYWIIKNSWGPAWGDKGYIKMKRGASAVQGLCGVAMQASYPIKEGPNPPEPPPSPPRPAPGPPEPEPVDCDDTGTIQCPPGSTCCCMKDYFGFCFTWACCPMPKATCCDDHEHCCPSEFPVCDTDSGKCSKGDGFINAEGTEEWAPMVKKIPAKKTGKAIWERFIPRRWMPRGTLLPF